MKTGMKLGVSAIIVAFATLLGGCQKEEQPPKEEQNILIQEDMDASNTPGEKVKVVFEERQNHLSENPLEVEEEILQELTPSNEKKGDVMEDYLFALLERPDGSTNETEDVYVKVFEEETMKTLDSHFADWKNGEISEKEMEESWNKELEKAVWSMKDSQTLKSQFKEKEDIFEQLNEMVTVIGEKTGTTAPHVLCLSMDYDVKNRIYTLYLALAEVE